MSAAASAGGLGIRPFKAWTRKAMLRERDFKNIEPIPTWKIVRGDIVYIRSGRDAGKTGRVTKVLRKVNRLIVDGCNMVKRHVRVGEGQKGGVIPMPSPIHYSNVNLLDPTLGKPTRIAIRFKDDGTKVRISKKSGSEIPYPEQKFRYDIPNRPLEPGPKDTPASVVSQVTYAPPPELIPYLSRTKGVFAVEKLKEYQVPDVVRNQKLRRHDRNKIRKTFDLQVQKLKTQSDVNTYIQAAMKKTEEIEKSQAKVSTVAKDALAALPAAAPASTAPATQELR